LELRHLTAEPVQTECTKVVYLVRSQLSFMKFIASHIQNDIAKAIQRDYYVYFVPRRSVACEKVCGYLRPLILLLLSFACFITFLNKGDKKNHSAIFRFLSKKKCITWLQ